MVGSAPVSVSIPAILILFMLIFIYTTFILYLYYIYVYWLAYRFSYFSNTNECIANALCGFHMYAYLPGTYRCGNQKVRVPLHFLSICPLAGKAGSYFAVFVSPRQHLYIYNLNNAVITVRMYGCRPDHKNYKNSNALCHDWSNFRRIHHHIIMRIKNIR